MMVLHWSVITIYPPGPPVRSPTPGTPPCWLTYFYKTAVWNCWNLLPQLLQHTYSQQASARLIVRVFPRYSVYRTSLSDFKMLLAFKSLSFEYYQTPLQTEVKTITWPYFPTATTKIVTMRITITLTKIKTRLGCVGSWFSVKVKVEILQWWPLNFVLKVES